LDDFDGFVGGERMLQDGGVAQQAVALGEDEFGDGHVFVAAMEVSHATVRR
jgi:hypothetical protein